MTQDNNLETSPHVDHNKSFLERILLLVKELFPDLRQLDLSNTATQDQERIVATIIDLTWSYIENDPTVQRLGRDGFNKLPRTQQLRIVQAALDLMKINKEVSDYLKCKNNL